MVLGSEQWSSAAAVNTLNHSLSHLSSLQVYIFKSNSLNSGMVIHACNPFTIWWAIENNCLRNRKRLIKCLFENNDQNTELVNFLFLSGEGKNSRITKMNKKPPIFKGKILINVFVQCDLLCTLMVVNRLCVHVGPGKHITFRTQCNSHSWSQ